MKECINCSTKLKSRYLIDNELGISLLYCKKCGTVCNQSDHNTLDYSQYNKQYKQNDSQCEQSGYIDEIVDFVSSYCELSSDSEFSLFDIGCGPGDILNSFGSRYPRMKLEGLDPSMPNALHAKENFNIDIITGFWEDYQPQFQPEIITAFGNIMLHKNPYKSLSMALDTLPSGGVLIFDYKNPWSISRRSLRLAHSIFPTSQLRNKIYWHAFHGMPIGLSTSVILKMISDRCYNVRASGFSGRSVETSRGLSLFALSHHLDRLFRQQAWIRIGCTKK